MRRPRDLLCILLAVLLGMGWGAIGTRVTAQAAVSGRSSTIESVRTRAEQGETAAQVEMGGAYHDGLGVPRDYREALKWYRKAAAAGDPRALYNLGLMYDSGQGVAQDYKEALICYTKAALKGNAAAQQNLGVMYAKGQGVAANYLYSYAWSTLAAEQGQAGAAQNRDAAARHLPGPQLQTARELTAKLRAKVGLPATAPGAEPGSPPPRSLGGNDVQVKASGTGFIITADGYLLTCHHVIAGGRAITVKVGPEQYPARLIRDDPKNDLALLKINGSFRPLAFASQGTATLGQEVFTIGYPDPLLQGVSAKFTKGEISSLAGVRDDVRLYQISVPVQPGNSGGPLLDMDGNVTGVIEAMLDAKTVFAITGSLPQSVNYAVKGSMARALLAGLPAVTANLPPPAGGQAFAQVVEMVSQGTVMVLVH